MDETIKKKNPASVKISPHTLAQLNAEDVPEAVVEARKRSKTIQSVVTRKELYALETT